MKNKIKLNIFSVIFVISFFFLNSNIYSQSYSWESPVTFQNRIDSYLNNNYRHEIYYDNFGIHLVEFDSFDKLYYRLFGNDGNPISNTSFNTTNLGINFTGASITSYNNKIYIACKGTGGLYVFEKNNELSPNYQLYGPFSGSYYDFGDYGQYSVLSAVSINDKIFISWDMANYEDNEERGSIGFCRYEPSYHTMDFYGPLDYWAGNPNLQGGIFAQLTKSSDKLHVVYTRFIDNEYFVVRNISFNQGTPEYGTPVHIGNWGTPSPGTYINYNTKANILNVGNFLYLSAKITRQYESVFYIDTKFKVGNLLNTVWGEPMTVIIGDKNSGIKPSMVYDINSNKILNPFTTYEIPNYIPKYREYNISNQTLENPIPLDFSTTNGMFGGLTTGSIHGDFIIYPLYQYPPVTYLYKGQRRPRAITENFTYNTLLTGNEYINAPTSPYCHLNGAKVITMPNSHTYILDNTHIWIDNYSQLELNCGSYVHCSPNILIQVMQGGSFCNRGAQITGVLRIQYQGGRKNYPVCVNCGNDNIIFNDSTFVQLLDSATVEIPENSSLIFEGDGTTLQLDSNSKIVFGNNSNLIIRDGAKIKAYHSKFVSTSGSALWGGIYLEDNSFDTIQHCDIENAYSGLNILNKINTGRTPVSTALITNCNFKNTSTSQLLNGIYASNSNYFLLKDNSFSSTNISNGFTNAITLDGCPSGALNIIGNCINNSLTGINIIQSSPLILRNTIHGFDSTGYGVFLDNSNGSIKYNIINNFSTSIMAYYSNPYLLKNTLNNAYTSNLELISYSVPILKPIINGSSEYWFSGNNIFNGNPTSGAIVFQGESYPELDSGYNLNAITTGLYMKGDIPSFLNGVLYATYNYWGNGTPESNRFDISSGDLNYEPYYDGSALPTPESFETADIGFNLLDTVYINDLGDSPGRNLFLEANAYEMQGEYEAAIIKYKNIILNYKNSIYSVASLSRNFNCLDKLKINNAGFISHQNYLGQLRNNNTYPVIFRELCEDFIIKTKVRLGFLGEAISDYTTMYNQNQNNSKGFHALLNKECLLARGLDTTDNSGNFFNNLSKHKIALFGMLGIKTSTSFVSHKNIPNKFELSQNYPNPFNPNTKINYELPKESRVRLVIYDILGREVKTLVNEMKTAGSYTVEFNGSHLASGVYFYRIQAGDFVQVKRMILVK